MVSTAFGLRLQVQLMPVMQLFVTLDKAAQGRVQGEWCPRLAPTEAPLRACPPEPCPFPTLCWPLRPLRELQRPGRG